MLQVDTVMLDYLTLTTFDPNLGRRWMMIATMDDDLMRGAEFKNARRLQYNGRFVNLENGSIFAGRGEQGSRKHWMLQISGSLSHDAMFGWMVSNKLSQEIIPREGEAFSCSRIDLQATVDNEEVIPKSSALWQASLFDDVRKKGKKAAWFEDDGKHGSSITIGINKRAGSRYYRIYPKQAAERDCMRFEIEYKRDNANRAFNALSENGESHIKKILSWELKKLDIERLNILFVPLVGTLSQKLPKLIKQADSNTVTWLLSICLPSLHRVLTKEPNARMIYNAFKGVLDDWELSQE